MGMRMQAIAPTLLALAVVGVLLFLALRRAARRRKRKDVPIPRVEGFLVSTPLHPRMLRACVFDRGLLYGRGFRRKEGPALPHGPDCQCRATPIALPGTEVFSGSLRRGNEVACAVPGFPADACRPLLDALRRVNAESVPPTLDAYLALADLASFAAGHQAPVRRFLEERYRFLKAQPGGHVPAPAGPERPQGAA
jgi:hypothetical protein